MVQGMGEIVQAVVNLIVAAGVVAALAALPAAGPRTAVAVLLDFLLAAGLLRLSQAQTWAAIATAALTAVIRKIAIVGFSLPVRRPPPAAGTRRD
ncbi:hypothetical protein GCM10010140_04490 [Streptosporangium pseudovulgare]|uniref:DUF1622 domain-containing protein n=2 Tax=Streptosporangium pseudovulgare TaxID=35765 RepID=A0ABQ2QFB8_9ACTN|nr:hypothetical protein GCM10010140_04490 [Streptosporangium pseudovulgare]